MSHKEKNKKSKILIANKILNIIMMIGSFIKLIYFIKRWNLERIFICLSMYLVIFLPNILNKTKFKLEPAYLLTYTIFVFLAQFLGSIFNLYQYIWWYDLFLHFISGILTFIIGLYLLEKTNVIKIENKLINFIYLIGLVSFIAISWEILEYIGDVAFGMNSQHNPETGVNDTMQDMIVALFGGLLSYLALAIKANKKPKLEIKKLKTNK